jgi:hypothetical protein
VSAGFRCVGKVPRIDDLILVTTMFSIYFIYEYTDHNDSRKRGSNGVKHAPIIGVSLVGAVVLAAFCLANAVIAVAQNDEMAIGATVEAKLMIPFN